VTRIVFLGDSLTWGGYGGNFVAEVKKQMPQHEIINAGVGGDTVVNLMRRLHDVLNDYEPDAMFVMVGGNDATSYSMPDTRGYYRKSKGLEDGMVTPAEFESTYRELLVQVQLNFVQAFVGVAPTEYNRELIEARRQYNQLAKHVAESLNLPVLDLAAIFNPQDPVERQPVDLSFISEIGARVRHGWDDYEAERQKWGYNYTFDGMHLTPQAATEFANHIVTFLQKHIS